MDKKLIASECVYIDPLECDSTVQWKIIEQKYKKKDGTIDTSYTCTIQLADCSRKIDWYFNNYEESLAKVDLAIKSLKGFRTKLAAVVKKGKPKEDVDED